MHNDEGRKTKGHTSTESFLATLIQSLAAIPDLQSKSIVRVAEGLWSAAEKQAM